MKAIMRFIVKLLSAMLEKQGDVIGEPIRPLNQPGKVKISSASNEEYKNTSNIIRFQHREPDGTVQTFSIEESLEIIDILKQDLESGKIIGFTGVGVSALDECYCYGTCTAPITRLRMLGALTHALQEYMYE